MSLTLTSVAVVALLSQAGSDVTEPRLMRTPAIHGDTIVFSYAGDLWVTKVGSGAMARRLTTHAGQEIRPKISHDGKWVAFNGSYDGAPEVYVIPIEGGEPKRLTYTPVGENTLGWTPDGKIAYSSIDGSFTNRQQRLWYVRPEGGLPIRTPIAEVTEASFFPDGKSMAYTRVNSYAFNWRRYRGGTQGRISLYNFDTNTYSELPAKREQSYFPMVAGRSIFYVSDRNLGTLNLYRYDVDTKREAQITQYADADIKWPSSDGKSIIWERDGFLWVYDIASGKIVKQSPKILSENLTSRPALRSLSNQVTTFDISPSGTRILLDARGEIFTAPVRTGDVRNLTQTSGVRERGGEWSPDGQTIGYMSDVTGNWEIYTQPQLGGEAVRLTNANGTIPFNDLQWSPDSKHMLLRTESNELYMLNVGTKELKRIIKGEYGVGDADFSPDGRWLAFINAGTNLLGALYFYEIATGTVTKVTDGYYSDNAVAFDQGGKYLYINSTRTFSPTFGQYEFSLKVENGDRIYIIPLASDTPNPLIPPNEEEPAPKPAGPPPGAGGPPPPAPPMRIDFAGMADRVIALPMGAGAYPMIVGSTNGVFYMNASGSGAPVLARFDLNSRESQTILPAVTGGISFNPSRTKAAMSAGPNITVFDVRPGATPAKVDTSAVEAVIDPKAEWRQIFWDTWRYQRDNFYDPNMLGLNWKAIGDHYEKYLEYVHHRSDLSYVLGMMIGELGTGHAYISGGDMGPGATPVGVGQLGVDYDVSGNWVRFGKIYRGQNFDESRRGPLGEPSVNVKEGDYLLEIDGQPVNARVHPASLLLNKAGRYVTLTVNSVPSVEGARKVRVRPVGSEVNLRYADMVETNRKKVEELSGGRIGYMHVPDTQYPGAIEFIRGYYSQTDKDAMVVDERWNGGGLIQPWFVDTLARRMKAGIQQRNAKDVADAVAIEGPKAMLINEYAGSGGDLFPWMFRQAKLGPLIGKRTWGGLVGIAGYYTLVDGGQVSSPEFAIYDRTTGNIIAENTGVDPDIDVDMRPDLVARGQDPQLEAAVKYLLEELKKLPPKKERANIPRVGPQGRVGG